MMPGPRINVGAAVQEEEPIVIIAEDSPLDIIDTDLTSKILNLYKKEVNTELKSRALYIARLCRLRNGTLGVELEEELYTPENEEKIWSAIRRVTGRQ